ncbi:MAG: hypothetical protein ABIT83_16265 [Massilia sp.]
MAAVLIPAQFDKGNFKLKSRLTVILSLSLCGCIGGIGDIGVEMWSKSSTVAIDLSLYPACLFNAIDKFDKQNADKYTRFGDGVDNTSSPIPESSLGASIHLTKQKNLEVSLAARILPTEREKDLAEMYLSKTTQVLAIECNHRPADR